MKIPGYITAQCARQFCAFTPVGHSEARSQKLLQRLTLHLLMLDSRIGGRLLKNLKIMGKARAINMQ